MILSCICVSGCVLVAQELQCSSLQLIVNEVSPLEITHPPATTRAEYRRALGLSPAMYDKCGFRIHPGSPQNDWAYNKRAFNDHTIPFRTKHKNGMKHRSERSRSMISQWKAVVMKVLLASSLEVQKKPRREPDAVVYLVYQTQQPDKVRLVASFILKNEAGRLATFWVHWEAGAWLLTFYCIPRAAVRNLAMPLP
jgi:hypothetical protein